MRSFIGNPKQYCKFLSVFLELFKELNIAKKVVYINQIYIEFLIVQQRLINLSYH